MNRQVTGPVIALCLLLATVGCCHSPSVEESAEHEAISVTVITNAVKEALSKAQQSLGDKGLGELKSVDLTLKVAVQDAGGGTIKMVVIGGDFKGSSTTTQTISLSLEPPAADDKSLLSDEELTESLVNAIVAAGEAGYEVKEAGMTGEPKLLLDKVKTTVDFSVSTTAAGKIGFEVIGIEIGGSYSETSTTGHSVTLTFAGS